MLPVPKLPSSDPREQAAELADSLTRWQAEYIRTLRSLAARYAAREIAEVAPEETIIPALDLPTEPETLMPKDLAAAEEQAASVVDQVEKILERLRSEAEAARLAARSPVEILTEQIIQLEKRVARLEARELGRLAPAATSQPAQRRIAPPLFGARAFGQPSASVPLANGDPRRVVAADESFVQREPAEAMAGVVHAQIAKAQPNAVGEGTRRLAAADAYFIQLPADGSKGDGA
jgi:hypothetical protein